MLALWRRRPVNLPTCSSGTSRKNSRNIFLLLVLNIIDRNDCLKCVVFKFFSLAKDPLSFLSFKISSFLSAKDFYKKSNNFNCLFLNFGTFPAKANSNHPGKNAPGKHVRVMYTPLHPTFIYSKTGVYRGIHFFLIFALNIDRGYSLEPPH